ncbi:carbonic anhydrase gamma type [Gracilaria domingensis]|nr:carbonic anhydrase gamma type [Gracilaria domingensis]
MSLMRRAAYAAGMMIRETGQALDRLGCSLQGKYAYVEQLSRHRQIMNLEDSKPIISAPAFIAPSASLVGNVELSPSSSVWYGAVLRADRAPILIGPRASIGDRAVVRGGSHVDADATVHPGAVIDSAQVGAYAVVGASAVVARGAIVAEQSVLRGGSFLPEGACTSPGELWSGSPAQCERALTQDEISAIASNVEDLVTLAGAHATECGKTHEQIEAEKLRQGLMEERSEDYNSHLGLLGKEKEIVETQATLIEQDREEQRKVGAA